MWPCSVTDNKQPPTNTIAYAHQCSVLSHFIPPYYKTVYCCCHRVEISGKHFMRQARLSEFLLSFVKLNVCEWSCPAWGRESIFQSGGKDEVMLGSWCWQPWFSRCQAHQHDSFWLIKENIPFIFVERYSYIWWALVSYFNSYGFLLLFAEWRWLYHK